MAGEQVRQNIADVKDAEVKKLLETYQEDVASQAAIDRYRDAMLHQLPSTFMLVSPIPEYLTEIYDLTQRKCEMEDNDFKDILIYPKGYKMTRFDKAFINKLFEAKNEVAFKEYN